jgi:hypothetical protein
LRCSSATVPASSSARARTETESQAIRIRDRKRLLPSGMPISRRRGLQGGNASGLGNDPPQWRGARGIFPVAPTSGLAAPRKSFATASRVLFRCRGVSSALTRHSTIQGWGGLLRLSPSGSMLNPRTASRADASSYASRAPLQPAPSTCHSVAMGTACSCPLSSAQGMPLAEHAQLRSLRGLVPERGARHSCSWCADPRPFRFRRTPRGAILALLSVTTSDACNALV